MIHSIYIFSRVLTKDFKLIYLSLIGKIFFILKLNTYFVNTVCALFGKIYILF